MIFFQNKCFLWVCWKRSIYEYFTHRGKLVYIEISSHHAQTGTIWELFLLLYIIWMLPKSNVYIKQKGTKSFSFFSEVKTWKKNKLAKNSKIIRKKVLHIRRVGPNAKHFMVILLQLGHLHWSTSKCITKIILTNHKITRVVQVNLYSTKV